jgi:hypothetical protein
MGRLMGNYVPHYCTEMERAGGTLPTSSDELVARRTLVAGFMLCP